MNKVDLHVRSDLLNYPTLFRSRLSVLRSAFLTTALDWDSNGCLVRIGGRAPSDEMSFDDLDNMERELSSLNGIMDSGAALKDMYEGRMLSVKSERMDREFRAAHIDVYACQDVDTNISRLRYEDLVNFSPEHSCLGQAPFGNIDEDWLKAAEDMVAEIILAYNRLWLLHYDRPLQGEEAPSPSMYDHMPESWQRRYDAVVAIGDKLEAQSGRRARAAKLWERLKSEVVLRSGLPNPRRTI